MGLRGGDKPEKISLFLLLILFYTYFQLLRRGLKYDESKFKLDRKYNGYHFIRLDRRGIKFPAFIKEDTNLDEFKKMAKTYNFILCVNYFIIILLITICLNACLRR